MKRCLFFLLCLFQVLSAEQEEEPISLVNQIKSPISRAAGSVNIISGNWVDQTIHYEISGPDPYVVAHSYISSSIEEGTLADGWDFFHPSELEVFQPKGINYITKKVDRFPIRNSKSGLRKDILPIVPYVPPLDNNKATLFYRDAGGATVVFKSPFPRGEFKPKLKNTGYVLVSSISNPVRRDLKRVSIEWESASDHWIVKLGDGTRRVYSRVDKHRERPRPDQKKFYKRVYHIKEEFLPSGNRRQYHYDRSNELTCILTVSSDEKYVLHTVGFQRDKDEIKVVTSDGISTKFSLKKLHDRETARVVDTITRPAKDKLSYLYSDKSSHHERRIEERLSSTGRKEAAKFYHEGKNEVGNAVVKVSSKKRKKFLENRVREIWTKDLPAHHLTLSHAFRYKEKDRHSFAKVFESDKSATIYFWDKDLRPNWIGYKNAKGELLRAEHFIWTADESRLWRRTLLDEKKNPLIEREFSYDTEGNVTKESLRGSFTGRSHKPFTLDKDKEAQGGEVLTWKATYSAEGRSLKESEVDPLGNHIYYEYEDSRDLLTARFTCDQKRIIKREFFTYDCAGICIESFVDDGSSCYKSSVKDVTRRLIHRITPRRLLPFFGVPDEERWLVFTKESGEQLLKVERYIRDQHGRAIAKELVDASGAVQKRWTYAYDEFHRVIESCDPTGRIERYSYDDAGHIAKKKTPEATYTFSYDLLGRVIEEKKTFPDGTIESICRQYDLSGRTVTEIDGRGREKTTVRDLAGRIVSVTLPALATEAGAVRPKTLMTYQGSEESCTSPSGAVTKVFRSATGKPLVTVNAFGAKTHQYYDERGRLVEQKDPSDLVTRYEYDALDRPLKVEQLSHGESISVITKTYHGFDLVEERHPTKLINYTYDSLGHQVKARQTDLLTGQTVTTRTAYDSIHRPICIFHDDVGTEEHLTYDASDRVIERRVVGTGGELISVTLKAYDAAGRVVEEGVGRASTIARTKTTYGAFGLPSTIVQPDGSTTRITYNPHCRWKDGHVYFHKLTTDARGVVTEELLDSNDQARLILVRDPLGAVISSKTVTFSLLGKPVLIEEEVIAQGHITEVIKTKLQYDIAGQVVACTVAEGTPEAATWQYRYDEQGRKIEEIKPSGVSLISSYDTKGRLSSFMSSNGSVAWFYKYNVQDLPIEVGNGVSGGRTVRTYNGLGVLTSETLETGLTLTYGVNQTGLLESITYPDKTQTSYTYSLGRLNSISRKGYTFQVTGRDTSGMITSASLPSSSGQITSSLDVMGRRTLVKHAAFSEERTLFDPVGCCLERMVDGKHEVFSYDFLCQLTNDNGRTSVYDSLFRRIESEGKKASHNARHQILSQGDRHYQYDSDGRRKNDDRFKYGYDACDRLTSVEDDTVRYEYAYDAFNRRISSSKFTKKDGGWSLALKENYLWQGECEIGSIDESGKTTSLRVLGEGLGGELGAAVLIEVQGQTYIPIHDLSGHVRVLLTPSGEVVEKLSYTAFGLESRTANITPWTFSSKRQDDGTGFLYFGRRFYDPLTATWMTQDPLGMSAGPNLYAYVKNNPLTLFDLFGLLDQPNDRGFFGGLWDFACDVAHNVCETIGDIFSPSAPSSCPQSAKDTPAAPPGAVDTPPGTRPVLLKNGIEILPGQKYSDRLLIYPHGSLERFIAEFKGKDLGNKVYVFTPGACTTLHEACLRAEKFMNSHSDKVEAVIILYNATQNIVYDLCEAFLNSLGFELSCGRTLRTEYCNFLDACIKNDIHFHSTNINHSQGVATMNNILKSSEFQEKGPYREYIKDMINLGGPVLISGTKNYAALGDPVSLLALMNIFETINEIFKGQLEFVFSNKMEFPHNYDGAAYQKVVSDYMSR